MEVGFGLSAWLVVRLHRAHAAAVLILYMTSVLFLMVALVTIVGLRSPAPTPLPRRRASAALSTLVGVALQPWRPGFHSGSDP